MTFILEQRLDRNQRLKLLGAHPVSEAAETAQQL
jgi:hypothetical protein